MNAIAVTTKGNDPETKQANAKVLHAAVAKCKTLDDLRNLWTTEYGNVGHKMLARLFLGQSAEQAASGRGGRATE